MNKLLQKNASVKKNSQTKRCTTNSTILFAKIAFTICISLLTITGALSQVVVPNYTLVESYSGTVSSVTVTMPAGSENGDMVIVHIATDDDETITHPSPTFEQVTLFNGGTNGPTSGLYYRIIDGNEAATYNFAFPTSSEPAVVTTLRYHNSDIVSNDPIHLSSTNVGNNDNPLAPSITTTDDNKTILQFVAIDGASAGVLSSNTATNTVLAAEQSGDNSGVEVMATYSYQETAGATPEGSYSFASEQWATITLALNTRPKRVTLSEITGSTCSGNVNISVAYDLPDSSGNIEFLDPLGNVVDTKAYTSTPDTVSFSFARTISGNYTIRSQTYPDVNISVMVATTDTDGDGVCDDIDLDDDNDGILDSVEDEVCNAVDYNVLANKQQIQISSTASLGGSGGIGVLLDGNLTQTTNWYLNATIVGKELVRLNFPSPTVLTGIEYYIGNNTMLDLNAVTKIQGSNNGSTWVDMSPPAEYTKTTPNNTLGVISSGLYTHTFLWTNTVAYKYYRHLGVSGGANPTPYVYELYFQTAANTACDFDGDGIRNSLDLDSDNDGIPDNIEGQATASYTPPNPDTPTDYINNDGVNSAYLGGLPAPDTDGDGSPDFIDLDSDNDRDSDALESGISLAGTFSTGNGMDNNVKTTDDYTDVNGIVNDPTAVLIMSVTGSGEANYREIAPEKRTIKVCYDSNAGATGSQIGGLYRTFADDKLLNPLNFGLDGISTFTFELYNFNGSEVSLTSLETNGCQIFDTGSGSGKTENAFSTSEIAALKTWTMKSPSNVILAFQGNANVLGGENVLGQRLYFSDDGNNSNPNTITTLGASVINGPFGDVAEFNQGGSYQGTFEEFPVDSTCILVQSKDGLPTGVLNRITGDIYLADWGMVAETADLTNNNGVSSNTDKFFANLYHSLARIVVFAPTDACTFLTCPAGDDPPVLTQSSVSGMGVAVDVNPLYTGTPPNGTTQTWHNATPVSDENFVSSSRTTRIDKTTTLHAAFRANDGTCYSPSTPLDVTIQSPDLSVTFSPIAAAVASGETQEFTVTVTNNGPINAPEALVKIPISAGRSLVRSQPSQGSYDGGSALWNIGALNNGASATMIMTIKLD